MIYSFFDVGPDARKGLGTYIILDRQREEVEAFTGALAGAGGRQQHGFAVQVGGDRTLRLLGEASGLEPDCAGAEASIVEDGFSSGDFRTFQEVPPSLFRLAPSV